MGEAKRNTDGISANLIAQLRANLVKLREHAGSPPYQQLAGESGIGYGTLQRLYTGSAGPSGKNPPPNLDTLVALAKHFKVEPWQLLVPDFDPANPPRLAAGAAVAEPEVSAAEVVEPAERAPVPRRRGKATAGG